MIEPSERQYWLWVTRPDYYWEDDGSDREILDPTRCADSGGWWTCHRDTKKGDLIFLWRTSPKKDIGYLIQAESDAYSIADDNDQGWDYGCDYEVLYKFEHPIQIKDLRNNPSLDEWGPLKGSFQKTTFKILPEDWIRLNNLAADKNPGYQEIIKQIQKEPLSEGIRLEIELEDALAANFDILKKFGHDLELYVDPESKQSGRQFICKGNGGRIDLLCCDRTQDRYVVIELKNVRAGQNTFGQISNYMGWVQNRIAGNIPVIGIVISRGYDTRFESALKITDKISHINVEDLGFAIAPSKRIQQFTGPREKDTSPLGIKFANSREAKTWLKKGNTFLEDANYEEATPCYDRVLEKDPKNKWAWINKGLALAELAKHEEAILCLEKATEMYPKSAQVWHSKGTALISLSKFEEAIDALDKAIEIKPKSADSWNYKGMALANLEKYDQAIEAYNKAIVISPKYIWAWNNKGLALSYQDKYNETIDAFDKAIELDPKETYSWNNKGIALNNMNRCDEAINAFDKAIELDPKNAFAWSNKGYALSQQGKYDAAIHAFNETIKLNSQDAYAWHLKGDALDKQGKHDDAMQAYNEAIKLDPKNAYTWNNKGYSLSEKGEYDAAITAYVEAIRLDPTFEEAWFNKGDILNRLGKYAEAVRALEKATELDPEDAAAWNKKGDTLNLLGCTAEANAAFDKAKELKNKD